MLESVELGRSDQQKGIDIETTGVPLQHSFAALCSPGSPSGSPESVNIPQITRDSPITRSHGPRLRAENAPINTCSRSGEETEQASTAAELALTATVD